VKAARGALVMATLVGIAGAMWMVATLQTKNIYDVLTLGVVVSASIAGTYAVLTDSRPASRPKTGVSRPPGSLLLRMVEPFVSRRTYQHIALPVIADMLEDYYEALAKNRRFRAFRVRGGCALLKALGLNRLLRTAVEIIDRTRLRS